MRSHAKAESAGSNQRQATGLGRVVRGAFACLVALLAFTGVGASSAGADPVPGDPCPNGDIRAAQGVTDLPTCMALEMVSPAAKDSQFAEVQSVSRSGNRVTFRSRAALADTPGQVATIVGDVYVATRTEGQWVSAATVPPTDLQVTAGVFPQSFNPEFTRWFQLGVNQAQYEIGVGRYFHGGLDGGFAPVSPLLVPLGDPEARRQNIEASRILGASADHSLLAFRMGEASALYGPDDPLPSGAGSDHNAYITRLAGDGEPSLELLARDRDAKVWGGSCGARVGGIGGAGIGWRNQGAISPDGLRLYFSTRPSQPEETSCSSALHKLRILERTQSAEGAEVSELFQSECDRSPDPGPPVIPACGETPSGQILPDGDDFYQGASADGSKVYFTTSRQLADSDTDGFDEFGFGSACVGFLVGGCDLYLYDRDRPTGQRLIQVSAGESSSEHPDAGFGADVLNGTTAISGDGSRAYFVARGVLATAPNPAGAVPTAGQPNLYLYEHTQAGAGALKFIGTLASSDEGQLWGGDGTFFDRAYPVPATDGSLGGSGQTLVFQSSAPLTDDDLDGGKLDVFSYDSEGETLRRISKAVAGGSDNGPHDVAGREQPLPQSVGTAFAEEGRWVSEDGKTIVFKTADALLPDDVNGINDSYLWRDGHLARLPGTGEPINVELEDAPGLQDVPVLSHDGATVAFKTFDQLLAGDGDSAKDVYVAREHGGFAIPVTPGPCLGEECQGRVSAPRSDPAMATQGFVGRGNLRSRPGCNRMAKRTRRQVNRARQLRRRIGRAGNATHRSRLRRKLRSTRKHTRTLRRKTARCRQIHRGERR